MNEPTSATDFQAAILAELRAIRGLLEQQSPRRSLALRDVRLLECLVPALHLTFADLAFQASDVLSDEALSALLPAFTPARLGKLLARAAGIRVAGFVVSKLGTEGHVTLWQVVED
ncbi:MAG: hypothetical protein QM736_29865 [Vicinamibacterales bacterium]